MAEKQINFIAGETIPLLAGIASSTARFFQPGSWSSRDCMVSNAGANIAFIAFHSETSANKTAVLPAVATNAAGVTDNSTPILPGETMVLCKNFRTPDCTTVAAITITGTTQLYFTAGVGN